MLHDALRLCCAAQRGMYFAETSVRARAKIADLGAPFIRAGARVLTHGHSRVVLALLRRAVAQARPPLLRHAAAPSREVTLALCACSCSLT